MDSDLAWEQWGRKDPYFGVLTDDQYRSRNLTADAKAAFFATGAEHVRHVLEVCHRHFDAGFTPQRVLDFGCGTGRLVVPFAGIAAEVVGVDVSESMLAEARRNCEARGLDNVQFVKSTDDLGALSGDFDLIHSFIVFQHIPIGRGMAILRGILERLRPGGLAAVHLTYSNEAFRRFGGVSPELASPVSARIKSWGRQVERTLRRAARGARAADPEMQMNPYNATAILFRIQELGVREVFVEFTNHGGALGTMLYFQRPAEG